MPIYEYECEACNHRMEQFQSMKDAALTDCPECGQPRLHRVICAPTLIDRTPRTVGSIADRNAARMEKEGTLPAQVRRRKDPGTPWWRKGKKINKKILKDPKRYIATGEA